MSVSIVVIKCSHYMFRQSCHHQVCKYVERHKHVLKCYTLIEINILLSCVDGFQKPLLIKTHNRMIPFKTVPLALYLLFASVPGLEKARWSCMYSLTKTASALLCATKSPFCFVKCAVFSYCCMLSFKQIKRLHVAVSFQAFPFYGSV
jgi:hypothetical protein